jgi:hypothetical protein
MLHFLRAPSFRNFLDRSPALASEQRWFGNERKISGQRDGDTQGA